MQVILLETVENLGERYDVVSVKGGYGRNFLIPNRKALVANKANLSRVIEIRRQITNKEEQELAKIRSVVDQILATPIKVGAKVGTSGKIFGSVTNVQLADVIKRLTSFEVDRRKISIEEEVKTLGTFSAKIDFHPKIKEMIEFEVIAE